MNTQKLVNKLKENEEDFEWYPTTDEIIKVINENLEEDFYTNPPSILDCGAGNGSTLDKLYGDKKYAIEKSSILVNEMNSDIFIIGCDFKKQILIDKKIDVIFCNPPYSEYIEWSYKIIKESISNFLYLVIPSRWKENELIKEALKQREAKYEIILSSDFLNAERKARCKVDVLKVRLASKYGHKFTNPFEMWVNETFNFNTTNEIDELNIEENVKNKLVTGKSLAESLEELYNSEMDNLFESYKSISKLDNKIFDELGISLDNIVESLKQRISGLKNVYWNEFFNNLRKITDKLTNNSRKKMLEILMKNTNVDFNAQNAYSIAIWVIKNANKYFDQQFIDIIEAMVDKANIKNYKSNKKTFGEEGWRYNKYDALKKHSHYMLEYRIIMENNGGLCKNSYWSVDKTSCGLMQRSIDYLNDVCTIATNLGFDTTNYKKADGFEWDLHVKNEFLFDDLRTNEKGLVLFEAKAFNNGNLHLKFNQKFMKYVNVEFGKLKGWVKDKNTFQDETGIDIKIIDDCLKYTNKIDMSNKLLLGVF